MAKSKSHSFHLNLCIDCNDKKYLLCPQSLFSGFEWMILIKVKKTSSWPCDNPWSTRKSLHLTDSSWKAPIPASCWVQREKEAHADGSSWPGRWRGREVCLRLFFAETEVTGETFTLPEIQALGTVHSEGDHLSATLFSLSFRRWTWRKRAHVGVPDRRKSSKGDVPGPKNFTQAAVDFLLLANKHTSSALGSLAELWSHTHICSGTSQKCRPGIGSHHGLQPHFVPYFLPISSSFSLCFLLLQ